MATAALEEDKATFYAGVEFACAKVAMECPGPDRKFDPRRAAIALDEMHVECVRRRQGMPEAKVTVPS
jgi:hypothetical protein